VENTNGIENNIEKILGDITFSEYQPRYWVPIRQASLALLIDGKERQLATWPEPQDKFTREQHVSSLLDKIESLSKNGAMLSRHPFYESTHK
jgi:hypothetical protein